MTSPAHHPYTGQSREQRLDEIERALKFDDDRDRRKTLVREYLDLTEPEKSHA